ncbi:hypothetical protein BOX15_Mlig021436g1 [Macrostomum lignano]|uniref:Uncharacterized protein n=1 Tax=Macrostomum lignano TaxID=282301 RepID=A0A267E6X6_9PLAT|nr:hypothetical protein BOX15_Mlig021436g1 [Macrostomum lignano]
MDEAPGVEQQQQPQPLEPTQQPHPILRKKRLNQDSNSASNHHVRIAPSPTSHDENENEDDGIVEEPWKDRENPFRPGSDLDRQADSLLRNSRISRNSVHLAQLETDSEQKPEHEAEQKTEAASTEATADPTTATLEATLREDTVGLLTPSMAVAAIIADDAADSSGPDDEPEELLVASTSAPAAASSAPPSAANRQQEAPNGSASPKTKAPTKEAAGPVQAKGVGRACCDLM